MSHLNFKLATIYHPTIDTSYISSSKSRFTSPFRSPKMLLRVVWNEKVMSKLLDFWHQKVNSTSLVTCHYSLTPPTPHILLLSSFHHYWRRLAHTHRKFPIFDYNIFLSIQSFFLTYYSSNYCAVNIWASIVGSPSCSLVCWPTILSNSAILYILL